MSRRLVTVTRSQIVIWNVGLREEASSYTLMITSSPEANWWINSFSLASASSMVIVADMAQVSFRFSVVGLRMRHGNPGMVQQEVRVPGWLGRRPRGLFVGAPLRQAGPQSRKAGEFPLRENVPFRGAKGDFTLARILLDDLFPKRSRNALKTRHLDLVNFHAVPTLSHSNSGVAFSPRISASSTFSDLGELSFPELSSRPRQF